MPTWEIYSLGGGEALLTIFNGIAAIMGGKFFLSMMKLAALLGLTIVAIEVSFTQKFFKGPKWFLSFVLITSLAFIPKTSVIIYDEIEQRYVGKVDNVPVLLAFLGGLKSRLDVGLTHAMESAFSQPDDLQYSKSGMLMGSKLLSMAQNAQVMDSRTVSSMSHFMKQCVFYDLHLHLYSMKELKSAENMMEFIAAHTSVNRSFRLWDEGKRKWNIVQCKAGCGELSKRVNRDIEENALYLGKKLFPQSTLQEAKKRFLHHLPFAYDSIFKSASKSASEVLKQNIMINAFKGSRAHHFQGQYAATRAEIQSKLSYIAIKKQAETFVPLVKAVLEALFYGIFPLVLLLSVALGPRILINYIELMFVLAAWGPLYAILNVLMTHTVSTDVQGAGALLDGTVAMTLGTSTGIESVHDNIAIVAGYLSMSIPFIAPLLVKGGMSGLSGLATSMLAVPQSAVHGPAEQAASGSYNMGNVNLDNESMNNQTNNKMQSSPHMANQMAASSENIYGGQSRVVGTGETRFDQTGGFSRTPLISAQYLKGRSIHSSEQASQAATTGVSDFKSSMEERGKAYNMMINAAGNDQIRMASGESYNKNMTSAKRKSLDNLYNQAEKWGKANDFSTAASMGVFMEVSGGLPVNPFINAKGGISTSAKQNLSKSYQSAKDFIEQENLSESLSIATELSERKDFSQTHDESKNIGNAISENLNEAEKFTKSSQHSFSRSDSLTKTAQFLESHSANKGTDLTQPFFDYLKEKKGFTSHDLGEIASNPSVQNRKEMDTLFDSFLEKDEQMQEAISKDAYEQQASGKGFPTSEDQLENQYDINTQGFTNKYNNSDPRSFDAQIALTRKATDNIGAVESLLALSQSQSDGQFGGASKHAYLKDEVKDNQATTENEINENQKKYKEGKNAAQQEINEAVGASKPKTRSEQHAQNLEKQKQRAEESNLSNPRSNPRSDRKFVPIALRKKNPPGYGTQIKQTPINQTNPTVKKSEEE